MPNSRRSPRKSTRAKREISDWATRTSCSGLPIAKGVEDCCFKRVIVIAAVDYAPEHSLSTCRDADSRLMQLEKDASEWMLPTQLSQPIATSWNSPRKL